MRIPLTALGALRILLDALLPTGAARRTRRLERAIPDPTVVTLSVRSAFAALIEALQLEPGDEVAMSAATIGDMARLPEAYGLRVVPVALEPTTLQPCAEALERAIGPRTRLFVAAHLFGARTSLAPCAQVARNHGVLVVADAAQALGSDLREARWYADADADVTLLSLGAIKTGTALGGGIAVCRDAAIAADMQRVQASWPRRSRWSHAARALRYAVLARAASPWVFAGVLRSLRRRGLDVDTVLGAMTKGFGTPSTSLELREAVRMRPDAGLESTVARRIGARVDRATRRRRDTGDALGRRLGSRIPGGGAAAHAWWLVPVECRDDAERTRVRAELLDAGYDAVPIQRTNIVDLAVRAGGDPAATSLQHALLLPSLHGMSPRAARRLGDLLVSALDPTEVEATQGSTRSTHRRTFRTLRGLATAGLR